MSSQTAMARVTGRLRGCPWRHEGPPRSVLLALFLAAISPAWPQSNFVITTTSLPPATVGAFYSQTLNATGAAQPYTWALQSDSGPLPPGLLLSSSGVISGTPTAAGNFPFVVQATSADTPSVLPVTTTRQLSISVAPGLTVTTPSCPGGNVGLPYLCELQASGGKGPYTWSFVVSLIAGLPSGLSLDPQGFILGTPTTAGTSTFTVSVRDSQGLTGSKQLSITILPPPVAIETTACPPGVVGASYLCALTASGGSRPLEWSISRGTRPPGLRLDGATGEITGIPTAAGSFPLTITVTDADAFTASRSFTITIAPENRPALLPAVPSELRFSAASGGPPPPPQALQAMASASGLPFTASANAAWLRVEPVSGVLPAALRVVVDPARQGQGTLSGLITITAPAATPSSVTVPVTFSVAPPLPPKLGVAPAGLLFSFGPGASAAEKILHVTNQGSGSLSFTATAATEAGGPWLQVSPPSGTVSAAESQFLHVRINPPGRLVADVYTGRVTIQSPTTGETAVVPVTLSLTSSRQLLRLSSAGFTFTAVAGGGAVPPRTLYISNAGLGSLDWTATASTLPGGGPAWLGVSPTSGSSTAGQPPARAEIRVNATGLAAGVYHGQIEVAAPGADNSPHTVSVVLNVLAPDANPGLDLRPTGVIFTGLLGGPAPASQRLQITNLTNRRRDFSITRFTSDGSDWFVPDTVSGTVSPDQPAFITLRPNLTGLTPGVRRGTLTVASEGLLRTVSLLLVISSSTSVPRTSLVAQSGACTPSRLLPVFTSLGSGTATVAGWPTPVEVQVVDDCGSPLTSGAVTASFSNGDPPLSLLAVDAGLWTGTWTGRNARSEVNVTVNAFSDSGLTGAAESLESLQPSAGSPVFQAAVNAASFAPQAPLSPGSLISIFGLKLADAQSSATRLPLDQQLGTTQVLIAGRRLPLLFAGEGQVNAQVPYDLALNTPLQVIIRRGNTYSVPETVTVAASQPAVFTRDQTGGGQGIILNTSNELVAPGRSVTAGDAIIIYCTGLGGVTPAVAAGDAAPFLPLANTPTAAAVTIGGRPAEVFYSGLAPGFAGLNQINAFVPSGVSPGDQVPVVLTLGGQSSPPVTIAVR